MIRMRRNFQKIEMLKKEDDEEIRDQEGMCGIAKRYFDKLFEARIGTYEPVFHLIHHVITVEDNDFLTAPILKEELFEPLSQMHPDKSPGPHGFNPAFYQKFWSTCGEDIFTDLGEILSPGASSV